MDQHHDFSSTQRESALSEREGVEQPSIVNPHISPSLLARRNRKKMDVEDYVQGILAGNRTILSQAITLIESTHPAHQQTAQEIIERCLPYSGNSFRLGITGVPGAGKSTFIEALGSHLVRTGKKLAVLAIDPSSERTKGSILGDKTRMEDLSGMENAFIRPSPSAGSLGGVARKTRETIILCEAAGFTHIIVETVGVGQSETEAYNMVDYFLLIQLANLGDELQGIKRGIMEMADGIAINKAEGENLPKAQLAQTQLRNALMLFPPTPSGWKPTVETCSAYTKEGIDVVWNHIQEFEQFCRQNGSFDQRREEQLGKVIQNTIKEHLLLNFYQSTGTEDAIKAAEASVFEKKISPYIAAQNLLERYFAGIGKADLGKKDTENKDISSGPVSSNSTPGVANSPAQEKTENTPMESPAPRFAKLNPKLLQLAAARKIPHFEHALAVDAACSGNPGKMEYRGVQVNNGKIIFSMGPYPDATNNIGEFLGIVHALSFLNAHGFPDTPVYTDSVTGMAWVKKKKANTKISPTSGNAAVIDMIQRAEKWLHTHTYRNPILKWNTDEWGEIPADFGRK